MDFKYLFYLINLIIWLTVSTLGKSSLAAALFRLVELSGGHIYIDGEDISQLHLSAIRSKVSTIPQDPVLFAGTMRYVYNSHYRYVRGLSIKYVDFPYNSELFYDN